MGQSVRKSFQARDIWQIKSNKRPDNLQQHNLNTRYDSGKLHQKYLPDMFMISLVSLSQTCLF